MITNDSANERGLARRKAPFGVLLQRNAPALRRRSCAHRRLSARRQRRLRDHLVDQAVLLGLVGRQEEVALGVALDLLDRLAGALGQDLVQLLARLQDVARVDLDVGGLALRAARAAGGS